MDRHVDLGDYRDDVLRRLTTDQLTDELKCQKRLITHLIACGFREAFPEIVALEVKKGKLIRAIAEERNLDVDAILKAYQSPLAAH